MMLVITTRKFVRGVRPTRYAPRLYWHKYSILFPELRRGRDETYRRCELMTLTFDLGGHGACRWCGSTSCIRTPTLKFLGLTVRKIWHILCVCVSRPVTVTFDLLTLKLMRNVARIVLHCASVLHCTLGLWVLELFIMYATNGQTDGQTDRQDSRTNGQKQRLLPNLPLSLRAGP